MAGPVAGLALVENGRSWYRYNQVGAIAGRAERSYRDERQ